ncbi:hypothetical protein [Promicromonospora soli]
MNLPQTRDPAPVRRGRRERRRKPLLRAVAIGVTTAVAGAALVPVLATPDAVAHSHTELCSELVGQTEEYIYEEFPEEDAPPVEGEAEDYTFDAELDAILDTYVEPTREYLDRVPDEWATEPMDTRKRLDWEYKAQLAGENPPLSWDQWKGLYREVNYDQVRGLAYEKTALSSFLPMDTPDWMCRDIKLDNGRTTSAVNNRTRQFVNFSPGNTISQARLNSYKDLTRPAPATGHITCSAPRRARPRRNRYGRPARRTRYSGRPGAARRPRPRPAAAARSTRTAGTGRGAAGSRPAVPRTAWRAALAPARATPRA